MGRPIKYPNETILTALKETKGMVYLAASRIGCDADTIYHRAKSTPSIDKLIRHERGKFIDTTELKLFNAVMNDEPWAIQMALRTLGKDRGYVEKSQQEHSGEVVHKIVRMISPSGSDPLDANGLRQRQSLNGHANGHANGDS